MRRESTAERAAWTAHVEGTVLGPTTNKYGAERTGKYASRHEAAVAANLAALLSDGAIWGLREQVTFVLVEGQGKIRPIKYIADFVYNTGYGQDCKKHVCDAKGYAKNPVYRLKKKLIKLLHGIDIEEL